jgi:hypothetical protein
VPKTASEATQAATQAVVGAAKKYPKTATVLGAIAGAIGMFYGAGEVVFGAGEWKAAADSAHELAVVAQEQSHKNTDDVAILIAQSQQNQDDIAGLIDVQKEKNRKAMVRAAEERKILERTLRWCREGVIVDQAVCAKAIRKAQEVVAGHE